MFLGRAEGFGEIWGAQASCLIFYCLEYSALWSGLSFQLYARLIWSGRSCLNMLRGKHHAKCFYATTLAKGIII